MFARVSFLILLALTFAARARAAEYGVSVGGHMTSAEVDGANQGGGVGARSGVKVGLLMTYVLGEGLALRTGVAYDQRHFALTDASGAAATAMFEYIDVPANFHYAISDTFGVFAGALLGINIRDKLEVPHAVNRIDPNINGMIPLLDAGVHYRFLERWSAELYYERGLSRIADSLKNYSGYGFDVIFSF